MSLAKDEGIFDFSREFAEFSPAASLTSFNKKNGKQRLLDNALHTNAPFKHMLSAPQDRKENLAIQMQFYDAITDDNNKKSSSQTTVSIGGVPMDKFDYAMGGFNAEHPTPYHYICNNIASMDMLGDEEDDTDSDEDDDDNDGVYHFYSPAPLFNVGNAMKHHDQQQQQQQHEGESLSREDWKTVWLNQLTNNGYSAPMHMKAVDDCDHNGDLQVDYAYDTATGDKHFYYHSQHQQQQQNTNLSVGNRFNSPNAMEEENGTGDDDFSSGEEEEDDDSDENPRIENEDVGGDDEEMEDEQAQQRRRFQRFGAAQRQLGPWYGDDVGTNSYDFFMVNDKYKVTIGDKLLINGLFGKLKDKVATTATGIRKNTTATVVTDKKKNTAVVSLSTSIGNMTKKAGKKLNVVGTSALKKAEKGALAALPTKDNRDAWKAQAQLLKTKVDIKVAEQNLRSAKKTVALNPKIAARKEQLKALKDQKHQILSPDDVTDKIDTATNQDTSTNTVNTAKIEANIGVHFIGAALTENILRNFVKSHSDSNSELSTTLALRGLPLIHRYTPASTNNDNVSEENDFTSSFSHFNDHLIATSFKDLTLSSTKRKSSSKSKVHIIDNDDNHATSKNFTGPTAASIQTTHQESNRFILTGKKEKKISDNKVKEDFERQKMLFMKRLGHKITPDLAGHLFYIFEKYYPSAYLPEDVAREMFNDILKSTHGPDYAQHATFLHLPDLPTFSNALWSKTNIIDVSALLGGGGDDGGGGNNIVRSKVWKTSTPFLLEPYVKPGVVPFPVRIGITIRLTGKFAGYGLRRHIHPLTKVHTWCVIKHDADDTNSSYEMLEKADKDASVLALKADLRRRLRATNTDVDKSTLSDNLEYKLLSLKRKYWELLEMGFDIVPVYTKNGNESEEAEEEEEEKSYSNSNSSSNGKGKRTAEKKLETRSSASSTFAWVKVIEPMMTEKIKLKLIRSLKKQHNFGKIATSDPQPKLSLLEKTVEILNNNHPENVAAGFTFAPDFANDSFIRMFVC